MVHRLPAKNKSGWEPESLWLREREREDKLAGGPCANIARSLIERTRRGSGDAHRRSTARMTVTVLKSGLTAKGSLVRAPKSAGFGVSVKPRAASCAASTSSRVLAMAAKPVTSEQSSMQVPTVESQRAAARQMVEYFKQKKLEEEFERNKQLGWVPKAEISNGRWVMFGLLVGMLTEYSTGVSFIDQIKLLLVNLSIVDFD